MHRKGGPIVQMFQFVLCLRLLLLDLPDSERSELIAPGKHCGTEAVSATYPGWPAASANISVATRSAAHSIRLRYKQAEYGIV